MFFNSLSELFNFDASKINSLQKYSIHEKYGDIFLQQICCLRKSEVFINNITNIKYCGCYGYVSIFLEYLRGGIA